MELSQILQYGLTLILLAGVSFVQNMAFTFSSRSRNSGDPQHHRKAALCSNGIWYVCHIIVWNQIWTALNTQNYWLLVITGLVYVAATTEGSVTMMKHMLKTEKGKRKVGANG